MPFSRKKFELSPRLKLGVGRRYSHNQILKISAIVCLIFAGGLAINAGRLILGGKNIGASSMDALAPQVLGATDVKNSGESSPAAGVEEYKVQKGDTLFNLSQKFNISWTTVATLNNLKSPFSLKPGQILKIPK